MLSNASLRWVAARHVPAGHGLPPLCFRCLVSPNQPAELGASVVQGALDGPLADAERTGYLFDGEIPVVVKDDDLPLSRRKPAHRAPEIAGKARSRRRPEHVEPIA